MRLSRRCGPWTGPRTVQIRLWSCPRPGSCGWWDRSRTVREGNAYNEVLDAIGHNHSGWLYDAVGPAATILVAVTRATRGWARRTVLEILVDCLAWVRPEQRFIDADGRTCSVSAAVYDAVKGLEPELHMIAAGADTTVPIGRSAKDLLEALHEHGAFCDDPGS